MQRRLHNPKLAIGSRIRLSALGIERCSKLKVRTGVVVGINPNGNVQVCAGLAEADDYLDDALIYFGTATEWFDIYKTLETLMLSAGNRLLRLRQHWRDLIGITDIEQ